MLERAYLEISNICNLQCTFCPEVIREKQIIDPEVFRQFANEVKPMAKQVCLHLMGEPLAHPEFHKIMQICDELQLRIFLTTNGTLLSRHFEKLLEWRALDQINFSVHSFFANSQRQSLENYLRPLLEFSQLAFESERTFFINFRLWNLQKMNRQTTQNEDVIKLIESYFNIEINPEVNTGLIKSKKLLGKVYLHFDTEFTWPSMTQEFRGERGTCYGLRKQVAVHANGDVVPCCLDKEAVLKLGNLHDSSLKSILENMKSTTIRKGFENGQLTEELCKKCQYADRFRE